MFFTMTTKHLLRDCFLLATISFLAAFAQSDVGSSCIVNSTDQPGICKLSADCPSAQQQAQNGITPTICGFYQLTIPIVCCERDDSAQPNDNSFVSQPTGLFLSEESDNNPPPPIVSKLSKSEQKCQEYSKYVTDTIEALPLLTNSKPVIYNVAKCDYNGVALIVGGKPASAGEFPFMAAVGYGSTSNPEWRCGGTLISDYFVVTAAHCNTVRDPPVVVRLGELDFSSDNDGSAHKDFRIREVLNHPQYVSRQKYNDIALIRLTQKVSFTKFIRPACLYTSQRINQAQGIATGWGKTDFAGDLSTKLMKVALNIYRNEQCSRSYPKDKHIPEGIKHTMVCAGELQGGRDTCQGDSGGPLLVTTKGNQCKFFIIGVTSFGKSCGESNTPAVYTRVSEFISWIEDTVW